MKETLSNFQRLLEKIVLIKYKLNGVNAFSMEIPDHFDANAIKNLM